MVDWANELQKKQDEIFWDKKTGGIISRKKGVCCLAEINDLMTMPPESNAVSALNLLRLLISHSPTI
ncbi:MAG: hypothetical protein Ct9H300mP23_10010 [Nitrospinota bacterium]|nr:MAG: hypothetical protein Ct9H300mP23_10010 [Nitrospinota bacterium]